MHKLIDRQFRRKSRDLLGGSDIVHADAVLLDLTFLEHNAVF